MNMIDMTDMIAIEPKAGHPCEVIKVRPAITILLV